MSYNESLLPNSNYPPMPQSDWDRAPWNQEDPPTKTIEVTVSVTLSKTIEVEVDDTENWQDYTDLSEVATRQHYLPQDIGNILKRVSKGKAVTKQQINDLKDWNVDDFEVIEE